MLCASCQNFKHYVFLRYTPSKSHKPLFVIQQIVNDKFVIYAATCTTADDQKSLVFTFAELSRVDWTSAGQDFSGIVYMTLFHNMIDSFQQTKER